MGEKDLVKGVGSMAGDSSPAGGNSPAGTPADDVSQAELVRQYKIRMLLIDNLRIS